MSLRLAVLATASCLIVVEWSMAAERTTTPPPDPRYVSIADEIYLQEVGQQIVSEGRVNSIAIVQDQVFALIDTTLHDLRDDQLRRCDFDPGGGTNLFALNGLLWMTADDGVYRINVERHAATKVSDLPIIDMAVHNGSIYATTHDDVFRLVDDTFVNVEPDSGWLSSDLTLVMADGSQVLADPVNLGPIEAIASYSGSIYLLGRGGPQVLAGRVFETDPVDWGAMPSPNHRDFLAHGSRLLIATDRGVAQLRGAALTRLDSASGLPYEDTTCLASGFARDLWIGTKIGAIRHLGGDTFHYFGADHWLPADEVIDIAVGADVVYIATSGGIGIIRYEPYTLRKKADYFEKSVKQRGHQRLGFMHRLYWGGNSVGWLREISDNDGGHTAHYLAAMSFKFAVTRDETARREAIDALEAMIWLQTVTGTDGFFARSIWAVDVDEGSRSTRGSGGLPAKWYRTDDGKWMWKGDTSSDEVNAHFYAVALAHDLVAEGAMKKRAAEHLARITRHIIANGWVLRDMDGEPTRWGRWDPDYLLRPYGFEARGLNGMEAQTYVWTALRLTRQQEFRKGLDQLLTWGYHHYTVREKLTFPPDSVVPWDDELAFRCFHPLLTYADDPDLRSIYLRGLERHWEVMRMQKIPFFNFVYGGLTGNDCEAAEAVDHLRAWSLDTVSHSYRNSHRGDLTVEPGYTPYMGGTRAISPRESDCQWGSRSALRHDGGSNGRSITPPIGWLEDYWMGRYYGMIEAPSTDNSERLVATLPTLRGAAPYQGPARPQITD